VTLPSLLRKELAWSRQQWIALLIVFVVLPAAFAVTTQGFDHALPEDTPIAVVPANDSVSAGELQLTRGVVGLHATAKPFHSQSRAFRALEREQVYGVLVVPPDVTETNSTATVEFYTHGSVVPYQETSEAVTGLITARLDRIAASTVEIEHTIVGPSYSLSAYLIPTFQLALALLIAFTYVPYTLANERAVYDRLRIESSLGAVLGWKLAYFTALMAIPVVVFQLAAALFGYGLQTPSIGALCVTLLTFAIFTAVSMALTLLTGFRTYGRILNVLVFLGLLIFSGLFYPRGFFSTIRAQITALLPTHYSVVALRGYLLRDASLLAYGETLLGLAGVGALAVLGLKLAVRQYERGQ